MNDAQLVIGIMQNDNRAWQYICRRMKPGFLSVIGGLFSFGESAKMNLLRMSSVRQQNAQRFVSCLKKSVS